MTIEEMKLVLANDTIEIDDSMLNEFLGLLGNPDPILRDRYAYTILAQWIANDKLNTIQLNMALSASLRGVETGIGSINDDSVLLRSFSILLLASLLEHDGKRHWMTPESLQMAFEHGLNYLLKEDDLRDIDKKKGWIHTIAHGADCLATLIYHDQFNYYQQAFEVLTHVVINDCVPYRYGEQQRLAQVLVALMASSQPSTELYQNIDGLTQTVITQWVNSNDSTTSYLSLLHWSTILKEAYFFVLQDQLPTEYLNNLLQNVLRLNEASGYQE